MMILNNISHSVTDLSLKFTSLQQVRVRCWWIMYRINSHILGSIIRYEHVGAPLDYQTCNKQLQSTSSPCQICSTLVVFYVT